MIFIKKCIFYYYLFNKKRLNDKKIESISEVEIENAYSLSSIIRIKKWAA